jgi:uncharacterized membrane protein YeaQ/YmgE (transglycosylase-associated protein family)
MSETTMQLLIVLIGAVAGVITAAIKNKNDRQTLIEAALKAVEEKAYLAIVEAEIEWGNGTGKVKRSQVVSYIMNLPYYVALPNAVKSVVNSETIGEIVDGLVGGAFKSALAGNEALKNIVYGAKDT